MRVLIVDDSPTERLLIQVAVEQLGHECIIAADGEEAWQTYVANGASDMTTCGSQPRSIRRHTNSLRRPCSE